MAQSAIVINVDVGETRVALIENGIIAELAVERRRSRSLVGNIYLGKVTRVLPGMQAAFVDVGLDRAAFLHVSDVIRPEDLANLAGEDGDDDDDEPEARPRRIDKSTPIREVLREGQSIVCQISKGPISTKGARVTSHVSLPGRYVVYMPLDDSIGISKRIGNDRERARLREAIDSMRPAQGGLVVRTVAAGLTKKQLRADIAYLVQQWADIMKARQSATRAPSLIYEDLDIILRAARDHFGVEVEKIVIDDAKEFSRLQQFATSFMPERAHSIELYTGAEPIFDEYGIEDEIGRALSRKVPLPSGGHLIIDQAEALTAIDVNTGRFVGRTKDVDDTILQTNLEAVKEIAYQLRFRNIGGLIVLDFIDMERPMHRDRVHKALVEAFKTDKAKTTTVRISELGLVEMTRKRTRDSLGRQLNEPCFYCDGTGQLQSKETICHEIIRQIRREKDSIQGYKIVVNAHPAVADFLNHEERDALAEIQRRFARTVVVQGRKDYHLEQFDLQGV